MNPLIISCTKCDYTFSTNSKFDYKYQINDNEFVFEKSIAWCFSCKKIVFAELFPSIQIIAKYHEELLKVKKSIKNQIKINNKKRPLVSLINKKIYDDDGVLLNLEFTKELIKSNIDKLLLLKNNLNLDRDPRCLDCFSSDIQYYNIDFSKLKIPFGDEDLSVRLGVTHHACGGDFEISYSPVRLYRNTRDVVYLSASGLLY